VRRQSTDRGSVLVLALLVTLIILGIGLTVMWVASSGSKMSGNITRRQEALYSAEAGIERARALLYASPNSWGDFLKGCTSATRNIDDVGVVMCDAPNTGATPLQWTLVIGGTTTTATETQKFGGANMDKLQYTVWIRNDWGSEGCLQVTKSKWDCDDPPDGVGETKTNDIKGTNTKFEKNGRVIIRSEGIGRDGLSTVTLEVIVTKPGSAAAASSYSQAGLNAQGSNSGKAAIAAP
jgi:Tfp pilus assembly protein PilX